MNLLLSRESAPGGVHAQKRIPPAIQTEERVSVYGKGHRRPRRHDEECPECGKGPGEDRSWTRAIIERRLSGDLFGPGTRMKKSVEQGKRGARASRRKPKRLAGADRKLLPGREY